MSDPQAVCEWGAFSIAKVYAETKVTHLSTLPTALSAIEVIQKREGWVGCYWVDCNSDVVK
jgi:hypothetical protein